MTRQGNRGERRHDPCRCSTRWIGQRSAQLAQEAPVNGLGTADGSGLPPPDESGIEPSATVFLPLEGEGNDVLDQVLLRPPLGLVPPLPEPYAPRLAAHRVWAVHVERPSAGASVAKFAGPMPCAATILTCIFPIAAERVTVMNTSAPRPRGLRREAEQLRSEALALLQRLDPISSARLWTTGRPPGPCRGDRGRDRSKRSGDGP